MIKNIEHLKVHNLENYVFSVYEYEGCTITELLSVFFTKINEVIDNNNSIVDLVEWLKEQGLEEMVANQLNQWLIDGTLNDIINNTVLVELNDKIENLDVKIETVKNELNNFQETLKNVSVLECEPYFITECDLLVDNVQQGLAVHPITGEYYVASKYRTPSTDPEWVSDYEHFQITRCSTNGEMIDFMIFRDGGHGTEISLELDEQGNVYIWNAWETSAITGESPSTPGNDSIPGAYVPHTVGRVKWASKAVILPQMAEIGYPQPTIGYMLPVVSSCQNYIAFRHDRTIYVCDFNKYKNKELNILSVFTVPAEHYYLQGFTIDDKYFYWLTGTGTEITADKFLPCNVLKFEWVTGELIEIKNLDNYLTKIDRAMEPEGLYLYQDEKGNKTLFIGATHGLTNGGRRRCIYGMGENGLQFVGGALKPTNNEMYRKQSGRTKVIPDDITLLQNFRDVGWFYIDGVQHDKIKDLPMSYTGGAWIINSPIDRYSSTQMQMYIRNSGGNTFLVYRIVNLKKDFVTNIYTVSGVGKWGGTTMEVTIWSGVADTVGQEFTFTDGKKTTDYDYILIEYGGSGGATHKEMYVANLPTEIVHHGLNLGDSDPTLVYISEVGITIKPDKTGFTLTRRNVVNNSGSGFVTVGVANAPTVTKISGILK